jgi:hypothetical protein
MLYYKDKLNRTKPHPCPSSERRGDNPEDYLTI